MCYNGTTSVFAADTLKLTEFGDAQQKARFTKWARKILLPAAKIRKRHNDWACWGIMASLQLAMGKVYNKDTWKNFAIHPTWRDRGDLAGIYPTFQQSASHIQHGALYNVSSQSHGADIKSAD